MSGSLLGTNAEQSVEQIAGVGEARAEQLAEVEVETVMDLATADVETVARQTTMVPGTVASIVEEAKDVQGRSTPEPQGEVTTEGVDEVDFSQLSTTERVLVVAGPDAFEDADRGEVVKAVVKGLNRSPWAVSELQTVGILDEKLGGPEIQEAFAHLNSQHESEDVLATTQKFGIPEPDESKPWGERRSFQERLAERNEAALTWAEAVVVVADSDNAIVGRLASDARDHRKAVWDEDEVQTHLPGTTVVAPSDDAQRTLEDSIANADAPDALTDKVEREQADDRLDTDDDRAGGDVPSTWDDWDDGGGPGPKHPSNDPYTSQ